MNLNKRIAYKYRSVDKQTFKRDLLSLENSNFFAGKREVLNDPFEGRFDRSELDKQFLQITEALPILSPDLRRSFDGVSTAINTLLKFVDSCGLFSLSYTPLNELLWAHYGGSHNGYCIGYDIDTLIEFSPQNRNRIDVIYSDKAPEFSTSDFILESSSELVLKKLFGHKSKAWEYEREVRLITTPYGTQEYDFRAVKEIYFGLRSSKKTINSLMSILAGRGVKYYQVESPPHSYKLEAVEIPDAFSDSRKYKDNLAPIAEHAIITSHLKPQQQKFTNYLYKAAEIVRRDPYCILVENVDFSGSKGTPENPVIFTQYQREKQQLVTKHFTLKDIDEKFDSINK